MERARNKPTTSACAGHAEKERLADRIVLLFGVASKPQLSQLSCFIAQRLLRCVIICCCFRSVTPLTLAHFEKPLGADIKNSKSVEYAAESELSAKEFARFLSHLDWLNADQQATQLDRIKC
jgi:hypothetical protein